MCIYVASITKIACLITLDGQTVDIQKYNQISVFALIVSYDCQTSVTVSHECKLTMGLEVAWMIASGKLPRMAIVLN